MRIISDEHADNLRREFMWECLKARWRRAGCLERGEYERAEHYAYEAYRNYREAMRIKLGWTLS
jgi:hypothetical protein